MFKKKEKKSPEELEKEREARLDAAEKKLQIGIMKLEKTKDTFFNGMMLARQKGLKVQEQQYRANLSKCMAQIKMQEGSLMTLQLARQSKELVEAQKDFVDCLGMISKDIEVNQKKTNIKKVEDEYLKAKFAVQKQSEGIDELLELDKYSDIASQDIGKFSEFDAEIDAMIDSANPLGTFNTNPNKNRI
ncbi:MAG: hypothetical protein K5765_02930 [Clostridia bacterium]|nr:hypothetical protein [Clostridia bacterium]